MNRVIVHEVGVVPVGLGMRVFAALMFVALMALGNTAAAQTATQRDIPLSTSKMLHLPVPGAPQRTNSFPAAIVLSADAKYLAILNNGYGTVESHYEQSIALLELATN